MDKQYLTIVYRLPPGYEASQLCQHEHAVVLSWSHMKEDREELRAENEKLKANLDRHMEVIVKGRAANEALNREIVATKMLAGNPQAIIDLQKELAALKQASEPVGYVTHSGMSAYINAGLNLDDDTPLYLHPAPSDRDAFDREIAELREALEYLGATDLLDFEYRIAARAALKKGEGK